MRITQIVMTALLEMLITAGTCEASDAETTKQLIDAQASPIVAVDPR